MAMIKHALLRGERSHAVPHRDERQIWIFFFRDAAQTNHVLDQQIKAALAEISLNHSACRAVAIPPSAHDLQPVCVGKPEFSRREALLNTGRFHRPHRSPHYCAMKYPKCRRQPHPEVERFLDTT